MNCIIEKESFLHHLQKVANIVPRKTIMPILGHIKLEATGEELKLTATCLDIFVETSMKAVVNEEGSTTLPAKTLIDLTNRLTGTEIQLDSNKRFHCKIACGNAMFKIKGLNPADFPEMPTVEEKGRITLKIADYNRLIDQVAYAVSSKGDARKCLQGISFSIKDGLLTAVATDGKRLAMSEAIPDSVGEDAFDIIIPHPAAMEIKRLLEGDDPVTLAYDEKLIIVRIGSTTLTAKLLDGKYPDISKIIPKDFLKNVKLPTAALRSSLDLICIPLEINSNISLKFLSGRLELQSKSQILGEGADTFEIPYDYTDEMEIYVNPNYLRDPLKYSGAENLDMRINDAKTPIALECPGFKYILMPIKLR